MPMMVALKFFQYYPHNVTLVPIEDGSRWNCAIYRTATDKRGEYLEETLFDLGHYRNLTEHSALHEMNEVVEHALATIRTMSN